MLVVGNGRTITRNMDLPFVENGAVAIEGTKIVEVGTTKDLRDKYRGLWKIEETFKITKSLIHNRIKTFS